MKEEDKILDKVGRRDGMTVPEGYFADFTARMAASLEPTSYEQSAGRPIMAPRTFWQRVRPYVYMAAMFAGVWCMLKMFTMMTQQEGSQSLVSSPVLAEALSNETFVNEYILTDLNQYDIMDQMMEDGFDLDQLSLDLDQLSLDLDQQAEAESSHEIQEI